MAKRILFSLMLLASFAADIRPSYAEDGTPSSKDFEGRHGSRVPARFQPPTAEVDGNTVSIRFRSGLEGMAVSLEDTQGGTAIYEGVVSGMSGESVELRGAHLRVHEEHDEKAVHQDGGLGAGDGGDRADQPDLQHVALRANRQAQPTERLMDETGQAADTYIRTSHQKNEQKVCRIEK